MTPEATAFYGALVRPQGESWALSIDVYDFTANRLALEGVLWERGL
jgi:hypothetical protein